MISSVYNRCELHAKPFRPSGCADLHFLCLRPDTSRSCGTTDTGQMCHTVCLFTLQLLLIPNYTAGWQRRMCDDLPKVTLGDDDDDDDIEDSLIE